jgi:hypothetical protein
VFANVIPGLSFPAVAQVNGVGSRPYQAGAFSVSWPSPTLSWTSNPSLRSPTPCMPLGKHGFEHINIDGGWTGGSDL